MAAVEQLLRDVLAKNGIEGFEIEDGELSVQFDDITVTFIIGDAIGTLSMFSNLGLIPPDADAQREMYFRLLGWNNFGLDTGGGHLGLGEEEDGWHIFFSYTIQAEQMSAATLEEVLEGFVNMSELFQGLMGRKSDTDGVSTLQDEMPRSPLSGGGVRV